MTSEPDLFTAPPADDGGSGAVGLAQYAERAYLEYALSVVKGRALPDVCDGQKPVQRRILYSMERMGLAFTTASGPKAVKSARVVGDVLGKFHPHGDTAAYDAMVRMAQDFSQRYPLVDGQGNFGSRDGDGAAAMRYTEARLAPITRLLLDELDEGTVDFIPNYDGSNEEPRMRPRWLTSGGSQSTSKYSAYGLARPHSSTSSHQALSAPPTPMWLGTISSTSPMSCPRKTATSRRSASSPPSSGLMRLWSTMS